MFFILLRTAISMARAWSSLVMGTLINVQWQAGLFNHLLCLPLAYFERRRLGDIQSRFGSLDALRDTFTRSVVGALMDGIMVVGVLIMLVLYGGWLAWVVLGFTSLYVLIRLLAYPYHRQLSEESLVRGARASSYFMETLYGIATIKMQGMTERRSTRWLNLEIDTINTGIKVTKLELLFGGLNTFISACDRAAVDATAEVKAALTAAGTPIGPNDTAIAGHAIAAGAILVTNNVREFERVPGLMLEDWVK